MAGRKRKTKDQDRSDAASAAGRHRLELVMAEAVNSGLIGGPKDTVIRARVSRRLVNAAKKRAGVASDTELLEIALSSFALDDDFGEKVAKRKGTLDPDLPLEL
jgi:hypothetical protein